MGTAEYSTLWQTENNNTINASIEKEEDNTLEIELVNQDNTLASKAVANKNQKIVQIIKKYQS